MNLQKLFMLLRAKPGLTRAQALKYLKEHHGPIVLASATLRMRVKKYVQHHVIDAPSIPQLRSDRDWIVESWVDPNVLLPEPPTAADAILVREDEQKFPDHGHGSWRSRLFTGSPGTPGTSCYQLREKYGRWESDPSATGI